jgi:hypothetical protein
MQKVYRCNQPPPLHYCRETDVGWKETVFCVTECAREKYFGAAFSEGRPLGAAAGRCRSQLFPVAP